MEEFIKSFVEGTDPQNAKSEISRYLFQFRVNVNPNLFRPYPSSEIEDFLYQILLQLSKCIDTNSASTTVSVFSATTAFLIKIIQFYSAEMQKAFIRLTLETTGNLNCSILLISIFAFITNFVAKPFLNDLIDHLPIFHIFVNVNSDHLPTIISNLPKLTDEWNISLLLLFIKSYKVNYNSRYLLPILKIVEKDPDLLFNYVLESHEISLIAYVLSSFKKQLKNDLDFLGTADLAIEKLENAVNAEIDDCFSILSLNHPSFKLNLNIYNNQSEIELSVSDNKKIVLKIEKYRDIASFYLIPLPNNFLYPNITDRIPIIVNKFKSITNKINNSLMTYDEAIDIFNNFSQCEYNNGISAFLMCFADTIKILLKEATDYKIIFILRKILFQTKFVSWIHCMDILKIIEAIGFNLDEYIKRSDLMKIILQFVLNPNEKLSSKSMKLIVKLIDQDNYLNITDYIAKNIDFFSNESLRKHLTLLSLILKKINKNDEIYHLNWVVNAINENINDYVGQYNCDIGLLTSIFYFLKYFNNKNPNFKEIGFSILANSLNYLKGLDCSRKPSFEYMYFKTIVEKYMENRSCEIISKNAHKFKKLFPLIKSALGFLYSQEIPSKLFSFLFDNFIEYFPKMTFEKIFELKEKSFYNRIISLLNILPDSQLIATVLTNINNDSLIVFAEYYLKNPKDVKLCDLYDFANYLFNSGTQYENEISLFVSNLNESKGEFTKFAINNKTFISKFLPNYINNKIDSFNENNYKNKLKLSEFLMPIYIDDIQTMISYSLTTNSIQMVKYYVISSIIKRKNFSLKNIALPLKLTKFLNKHKIKSDTNDIKDCINELIQKKYLKKKELIYLCKLIECLKERMNELYKFVISLFENNHHFEILYLLAAVLISKFKSIPNEFVESLFLIIKNNISNLPIRETSICLLQLSHQVSLNESQIFIIRNLFSQSGLLTTELSFLISTMISSINPEEKLIFGNLIEITSNYIENDIPSFYCCGIRILNHCLQSMQLVKSTKIIEQSLKKLIDKALIYEHIPTININTSNFLGSILSMKHTNLHNVIYSNIYRLALITEYRNLIPKALMNLDENSSLSNKLKQLINDSFINSSQIIMKEMNIYFEFIDCQLQITKQNNQQEKLLDYISSFKLKLKDFDCYNYYILLEYWNIIIKKYFPQEKSLKILAENFMCSSMRFFPFFYIFAREIEYYRQHNEKFTNSIIEYAISLQNDCTHKCALEFLLSESVNYEIISLSLLEPESSG